METMMTRLKTPKYLLMVLFLAGFASATVGHAHHSFTQFDRDTEKIQTGTVVRWAFNNPHSWLYLNVENEDGTETLWSFEGSSPVSLIGRGITGRTFEPGSELTYMYCPLVDGRPGGHLGWIRLPDGSYINPSDGGCNGNEDNIERWKGWVEQGFMSNVEAEAALQ
jgi:hypothetical protein